MGKKGRKHNQGNQKKAKNKREADDPSDTAVEQVDGTKKCCHLVKAAKLGVLQNQIPHTKLGECSFCKSSQDNDAGVCICLRCAKQGCDRYSEDKHSLTHYKSTPSHCVTVNLHSMMVWCYVCDMELPVVPNTDLHECIKLIIKGLKLNSPNDQVNTIPSIVLVEPTQNTPQTSFKLTPNLNSRIKGLVNLGNTCFFNAVMQNLCQTELLHVAMAFVSQTEYSQIILTKNELPKMSVQVTTSPGSLITALNKLLYEFRSSSPGPLNPKFLFSEICKKAPRFKGFQQQDSQELLRYLLDSVKTEQLKRVKIDLLKTFEENEGTGIKSLPENKKEKLKEYVNLVTAPSVDSVFAGRLDSIVVCHQCRKESRVTESFLDLSLSLVVPQATKGKLNTNKDAKVPLRNKNKNNTHPDEQQNTACDGENSVNPQTPSKHQKKAAREARRKKGRKGKKRSVSHSASEDDKLETKQAQETMDATSDESDHEDHRDRNDSVIDTDITERTTADLVNSGSTTPSKTSNTNVHQDNPTDSTADDISDLSGKEESLKEPSQTTASGLAKGEKLAQDSGKKEVAKDSGLELCQNEEELSKNSGIDEVVTKDSGIEEAAKDSGIEEVAKDSGLELCQSHKDDLVVKEQLEKSFGTEDEQEKDFAMDLSKNNDDNSAMEDNIEGQREEKETNNTNHVLGCKLNPSSANGILPKNTNEDMAHQKPNSDLRCSKKEKEFSEKYRFPDAASEEKEDVKLENHLNSEEFPSNGSQNVSRNEPFSNDSKSISNKLPIVSPELNENMEECEILSANSHGGNESNVVENLSEKNTEILDLCSQNSDVKTQVLGGENESPNEMCDSTVEGTSRQENVCHNSCQNCKKFDQKCQSKNEDCGCLTNNDYNTKLTNESVSSCEDNRSDSCGTIINGIQKLDITGSMDSTSTTNEGIDNKNIENIKSDIELKPENPVTSDDKQDPHDNASGDVTNFSPTVLTLGSPYITHHGECSVSSCLSLFCSPEILEGRNKFACEECSKRKKGDRGEQEDDEEGSSSADDESSKGATASKPLNKKSKKDKGKPVVYTEATKQMLLSSTPPVLTLHFKRFQQVGFGLRKVPKHVDFPLVLDLAPFCRRNGEVYPDSKQQVLYSLIGVVEHSGGLNSGHYTACVKLKSTPTYGHLRDLSNIKDFSSFIEGMWKKKQGTCYAHMKPSDGQWYHVSDSRATSVAEARVLKSQAYMLFYERLPFQIASNLDD